MNTCPGFDKIITALEAKDNGQNICLQCKHRDDPYCGPVGVSLEDDRTPIEDRYPADCTDTHSPDYMG